MAEHFSFFDAVLQDDGVTYDREYNAQQFTKYFGALVTTGVMKGTGNMLAVSANGTNMVTKIDTGIAFVEAKYYENDSFLDLTHDTETLGKDRIDRIVVRMDLSTEARYVKAFIKKGVPSTNPVAPSLTQTPNLYEISLAQVKIVGGQTFIATNAITDERGTNVICPWAGSNILPSYDDNALAKHLDDFVLHTPYVTSTGTDLLYEVDLGPSVTSLVEGMSFAVKFHVTNGKFPKIKVNGLEEKTISNQLYSQVEAGALLKDVVYTLRYSGAYFMLQGGGIPLNNTLTSTSKTEAATTNAVKMVNDKFTPENWISVALQNGWTGSVRYYKDALGIVRVTGQVDGRASSALTICTLPTGYRCNGMVTTPNSVDLGSTKATGQVVALDTGALMFNESSKPQALYINISFRV